MGLFVNSLSKEARKKYGKEAIKNKAYLYFQKQMRNIKILQLRDFLKVKN